jgi:hypothetical protein
MNAWCDREVSREGYRKASHEGYRTKHLTLNYRRLERHCTLEGLHFLSYLKTSSF